jgi:hypothetical protein
MGKPSVPKARPKAKTEAAEKIPAENYLQQIRAQFGYLKAAGVLVNSAALAMDGPDSTSDETRRLVALTAALMQEIHDMADLLKRAAEDHPTIATPLVGGAR